jgi:hypothetical protein
LCCVVWCGVVWCGVVWCGVAEKHLFHDYFLDFLYFYVCFFFI